MCRKRRLKELDRFRRKKDHKRKRRFSSRSSGSDTSSSSSAPVIEGRDGHLFRRTARERPGVNFASVVTDLRGQLGERGHDLGGGPTPAVFRNWYDYCFTLRTDARKVDPYRAELLCIITALDEFQAGRTLEMGDILASRARYLAAGIERVNGK